MMNRRGILLGLASALAAPAIVHAGNLMPVKALLVEAPKPSWIIKGFDHLGQPMTETIFPLSEADWLKSYLNFNRVDQILAPTPDGGHMPWSNSRFNLPSASDRAERSLIYRKKSDIIPTV